jgi:hypothetical protein
LKRRTGLWFCALDSLIQRKQQEKRFPISAQRIGHRFMRFCDVEVTLLPKRRILFKIFLPICLNEIRWVAQIRRKAGSVHFCSAHSRNFCSTSTIELAPKRGGGDRIESIDELSTLKTSTIIASESWSSIQEWANERTQRFLQEHLEALRQVTAGEE